MIVDADGGNETRPMHRRARNYLMRFTFENRPAFLRCKEH
jgi:hypothetical protein